MLFGIRRSWLASAMLTKRGGVAVMEILMHSGEMTYIRRSLLLLLNDYRPRHRGDWLE